MKTKSHAVGGGFSVEFTAHSEAQGVVMVLCEWSPHMPSDEESAQKVDSALYEAALRDLAQTLEAMQ
jgi:hypothetical protein